MHEVSVMASIVEAVLEELKKYEVERVEEVDLLIGELTFLGREQLEFAFDVVTRGTILEGSKLMISEEKLEVDCTSCGYTGPVSYIEGTRDHMVPDLSCPKCGAAVKVVKGKGCQVTSLKVVGR
ncbi:MAG: hydrogenase maturation nickel metallochaperone HypA [Methanomassiliicoccales archaeon]